MNEQDYGPTRQERRETRRRPKMKVSGKSVFLLQELGRSPKRTKERKWTRPKSAR